LTPVANAPVGAAFFNPAQARGVERTAVSTKVACCSSHIQYGLAIDLTNPSSAPIELWGAFELVFASLVDHDALHISNLSIISAVHCGSLTFVDSDERSGLPSSIYSHGHVVLLYQDNHKPDRSKRPRCSTMYRKRNFPAPGLDRKTPVRLSL
jgi:hypothetical protein